MTNSKKAFEEWFKKHGHHEPKFVDQNAIWQAAWIQAIEFASKVCEDNYLEVSTRTSKSDPDKVDYGANYKTNLTHEIRKQGVE